MNEYDHDHHDGRSDFDFLVGHWVVRHRRLKERLAGCSEWDVFDGTCTMRPILDGQANVDDNVLALPFGSYRASSIRAYDPATRRWSIWWLDSRQPHDLGTPVLKRIGIGVLLVGGTDQPDRHHEIVEDLRARRRPQAAVEHDAHG